MAEKLPGIVLCPESLNPAEKYLLDEFLEHLKTGREPRGLPRLAEICIQMDPNNGTYFLGGKL